MFKNLRGIAYELKSLPQMIRTSALEVKRIHSLTGAAMLAALNIILHQMFTVIVSLTQIVSFAFVTVGVSGMLYGPVLTGMIGIATDIIKYLLKPNGGYFPGFTLNEFLAGFLHGVFLYKKQITLSRVFFTRLTVVLIINLCLTPMWLSMMYGKAFIVLVSARILKNLIMLPIGTLLMYFVLKKVSEMKSLKPNC
ncbi:folate family ECF transporter S component [Oscillospiraceae bacterium PP1C4]